MRVLLTRTSHRARVSGIQRSGVFGMKTMSSTGSQLLLCNDSLKGFMTHRAE